MRLLGTWGHGVVWGYAPSMPIFGFLFKNKRNAAIKPRLSSRLAMSEPVRLKFTDRSEQPAILQDVSSGGACLRTHQRMRVGDHLALSMYFGLDQRYELHARVVYALPGNQGFHARYGVRFVSMNDDERFRLDTFVNERVAASQFGVRAFTPSPPQNPGNFSRS
jgi:hypothetical protein